MIQFNCLECGMKFQVKDEFAGRDTKCPTCKSPLRVPELSRTEAPLPVASISGAESSLHKAGSSEGVTVAYRPSHEAPVGDLLAKSKPHDGRYIIDKEIARGGMGAVLRAIDRDIRREVAIKFMLDEHDSGKKKRFVEEAQITGQLEHPNIVPVHELGVDAQRRMFFTMKMVRGRTLAQMLEQLSDPEASAKVRDWSLGRLLMILVNICHALAYAHSRGVVHRDLKPANIMLGDFGEVYVMDWGLAKVLDLGTATPVTGVPIAKQSGPFDFGPPPPLATPVSERPSASGSVRVQTSREAEADLTQEGSVLGTPAYMPPEQANGNIHAIDERSDIYSLGGILYSILTLQAPVEKQGGQIPILLRVVQGDIKRPEVRTPNRFIPLELSAIAMKGLAKEPKDRYQTVEALRRDVELFLEGRSVSAKQDTIREMFWKLLKRNKGVSIASAVASVILAVVGVWSLIAVLSANSRAHAEEVEKEARTREAVPALLEAARMSVERRNYPNSRKQIDLALLYASDNLEARLLKAQILILEGEFKNAVAELDRYLQKSPGNQKATALRELCVVLNPEEVTNIIALAQLFGQQDLQAFSTGLLLRHAESIEARKQLLKPYRKKIEDAWPGLGSALTMDNAGLFTLMLHGQKQIVSLAPLGGMPVSVLRLSHCVNLQDLGPLRGMPLTDLDLTATGVRDLSPLKNMRLNRLVCDQMKDLDDLAPLKGMPLTQLSLGGCRVQDLSPLKGMPLTWFQGCTPVRDLSPLQGMPLTELILGSCDVSDLTPLRGMPLSKLMISHTKVQDLTPLQGMKLSSVELNNTPIRDLTPLRGMPFTMLDLSGCRQFRDLTPIKDMPLTGLGLGFTGVSDLSLLKDMPLTSLGLVGIGVFDLSPLKDMPLAALDLTNCGAVKDLGPLRNLKLRSLHLNGCGQVKDLAPLRGMPLTVLSIVGMGATDLTPLEGMSLHTLYFRPQDIKQGIDVVRQMKSLQQIGLHFGGFTTYTPEVFWRKYDAKEFK